MHKKTFLICSLTLTPVVVTAPLILTSCGRKYTSEYFYYENFKYNNIPFPENEEFDKLTTEEKINYLNKNINETIYCDDFLYTFVHWFDESVFETSTHSKIRDYIGTITTSYNKGFAGVDLRFEFKNKKDISALFPGSESVSSFTNVSCINLLSDSEFSITGISNDGSENYYTLETKNTDKYFKFVIYYAKASSNRKSDVYKLPSLNVRTRDYQNYEF